MGVSVALLCPVLGYNYMHKSKKCGKAIYNKCSTVQSTI